MPTKRSYGWIKDKPDGRDLLMTIEPSATLGLRAFYDLANSDNMPPIYDQLELGSCTANAVAGAVDFERKKQGEAFMTPSRLFIYYNERVIEGTVGSDSGAEIRDGIKTVATQGVCEESEWPYDVSKFANDPPAPCYANAKKYLSLQYQRVPQTLPAIKTVLSQGRIIPFGFTCYPELESDQAAQSGYVGMPKPGEQPIGGHAVCIVGCNDAERVFRFRNSWGSDWGVRGYGFLPYAYVLNSSLASDFWVISLESTAAA